MKVSHDSNRIAELKQPRKLLQPPLCCRQRQTRAAKDLDLGMISWPDVLAGCNQFLIKPLAIAQPCKPYLDIIARLQAVQANHVFSKIRNADRFAHFQYKHLSASSHGGSLQHQLRGLGQAHEVTAHFRVRYFDRPAGGNLSLKQRHDATAARKDIAEADRHSVHGRPGPACRRNDQLGCSLSYAHHADGIDGFVRGDHQKIGYAGCARRLQQGPGSQHIVLYGFEYMGFHEWDVFVCGRVKHRLDVLFAEHFADTVPVADVADLDNEV